MRLKIVVVTFTLFFVISAFSQEKNKSYQAPLVSQSLLLDITHTDTKFIAVGERGHIVLSDDGKHWTL